MSQHHRRELIEQAFEAAEKQTGPVLDLGIGRYGFAYRQGMDTRLEDSTDRQKVEDARNQHVFREAARTLAKEAGFSTEYFIHQRHRGPHEFAHFEATRLSAEREVVMNEWIDQDPSGKRAVDEYCAARAREDLANQAQESRPTESLASPDEYMARRNRGRCM